MRIFNMRLSDDAIDQKVAAILDEHEGFSTATKFVKQAVLEYYNRHCLKKHENEGINQLPPVQAATPGATVHGEQPEIKAQQVISMTDIDWDNATVLPDGTPINDSNRALYRALWGNRE